jgi:hypothetical protein
MIFADSADVLDNQCRARRQAGDVEAQDILLALPGGSGFSQLRLRALLFCSRGLRLEGFSLRNYQTNRCEAVGFPASPGALTFLLITRRSGFVPWAHVEADQDAQFGNGSPDDLRRGS